VHEEEVEVTGVVDEERLVAGGHHVAGLLVATVADLQRDSRSANLSQTIHPAMLFLPREFPLLSHLVATLLRCPCGVQTHLGHGSLASEASPDGIVDTLGLPPALTNALEAVTLVTLELRGALLDDRDVLLCGNHLCGLMLVFGSRGSAAAGKLESKSCGRSARAVWRW
jgi:hypothetical protein